MSVEFDFVDAALVTATLEFGAEEGVDALQRNGRVDKPSGEHEDVSVVVLSRKGRQLRLPAKCGANVLVFVEGHGDAVAGAANGDCGVALSVLDGSGARVSEVGIVARFCRESAEVLVGD